MVHRHSNGARKLKWCANFKWHKKLRETYVGFNASHWLIFQPTFCIWQYNTILIFQIKEMISFSLALPAAVSSMKIMWLKGNVWTKRE
jgi:hypothetical protein